MSIQGTISVSALFHDTDGTTAINVVSLRSSDEYTGGLVAIITGTAGASQTTITVDTIYRNAVGELVQFSTPQRIAFSWSGVNSRLLQNLDQSNAVDMLLRSRAGQVSASNTPNVLQLSLRSGSGTGTYTVMVYGE